MNDPQIWTTCLGIDCGGGEWGRGEQWRKIGTTVIEQEFKKIKGLRKNIWSINIFKK